MNTREKIRPFEFLHSLSSEKEDWVLVAGLFDPLTSELAQRLTSQTKEGQKLLTVVVDAPGTLLTAEARAILVASLRAVDAVVTCSEDEWDQLAINGAFRFVDEVKDDQLRTAEFVQFVLKRQLASAGAVSDR